MDKLIRTWDQANKENAENRRKALHNYDCKTSELQPYDNSAFLEMASASLAMLKSLDENEKRKTYGRGDAMDAQWEDTRD